MYKLVFILSIFGLVLSATLPENDDTQAEIQKASEDSSKASQIFTIQTSPDGTPLKQCECKEFHLCDRNDVYDPSLKESWIRCDNQVHVCCISKGKELVERDVGAQNDQPLADSPGQDSFDSDNCTCVAFDKCSDESYVNNYGQGIIDISIRVRQCDPSEVCCPVAYIKNGDTKAGIPDSAAAEGDANKPPPPVSEEQPLDPVTPSPSSATEEVFSAAVEPVTSSVDIEQIFTPAQEDPKSQCSCVPIESCRNDSINNNHGAGIIQVRAPFCEVSEVCCLISDVVAAAAVTPERTADTTDLGSSPDKTDPQECGWRKKAMVRVSNSPNPDESYTGFGEFPWMVMILKKDSETEKPKMICGGSIVAQNMVLTAAHCVHKTEAEKLIVRVGEYDYNLDPSQEELPHQERKVLDIRIHPFYRRDVVFNDMALLVTDEEFKFESHISSICLPFLNSKFADVKTYDPTKCIATGWGKESHGDAGTYQNTLKKVDLNLVDHNQCQKRLRGSRLGPKFLLHSSFICAGGEIGKDTCQGDGGGPLFCALRDKSDRYIQVGITSWGVSCGTEFPGVYTNVYANSKWLTVEINMSTIFTRSATSATQPKTKP